MQLSTHIALADSFGLTFELGSQKSTKSVDHVARLARDVNIQERPENSLASFHTR